MLFRCPYGLTMWMQVIDVLECGIHHLGGVGTVINYVGLDR